MSTYQSKDVYHDLELRIVIMNPPSGVAWRLQSGRDELVPPSSVSGGAITFEIDVSVTKHGPLNFRGAAAQGPAKARFLYLNSGTGAGQAGSCWDRRAKISLVTITRQQVDEVLMRSDVLLESRIAGTGRDGGPACASVPLIDGGWRIAPRAG